MVTSAAIHCIRPLQLIMIINGRHENLTVDIAIESFAILATNASSIFYTQNTLDPKFYSIIATYSILVRILPTVGTREDTMKPRIIENLF